MTPHAPICQSCGMPLDDLSDCGTDLGGLRTDRYCRFCFADGAFTDPRATADVMIDRGARFLVQDGMAETEAHALMAQTIPSLERWRTL